MRSEQEIFDDLSALCALPGYLHAICWFCFRDNFVKLEDKLTAKDLQSLHGDERLIRTEITTLIGLAIKGPLDLSLPAPDKMQDYITKTEGLLGEIHRAMVADWFTSVPVSAMENGADPFADGRAFREPIFYSGESAYGFQYRDFSVTKYANDDAWIQASKGFSITDAQQVAAAICDVQSNKLINSFQSLMELPPDQWTLLPAFEVSISELAQKSGICIETIHAVIDAFLVPDDEKNADFLSLGDFNAATAFPLIPTSPDTFLLLQQHGLFEALYDAPFYWMAKDKTYWPTATEHRGRFTEELASVLLSKIFGDEHVFLNVDIFESKEKRLGEIDVLVTFGDRAIILQAKSKKLTLEARKGNDQQLKNDFKRSVQDSYNQALTCAKALANADYKFATRDGKTINLPACDEIYIICVVADHYPSLALQARQFLRVEETQSILPPFVMDIFTLDVLAEMLPSPLYFLSYVNRRCKYNDRLMAGHELTILSYHLKQNLWLEAEYDVFMIGEDIAADLDAAMMVRREGLKGKATPSGILTKFAETSVGTLIESIERAPNPATIAFGFFLLTLGEDALSAIRSGIDRVVGVSKKTGTHHDFTIGIGESDTGLTVHCNDYPNQIAAARLQDYCRRRKYKQRAGSWFGICLSQRDGSLRLGVNLDYEWQFDQAMEAATHRMDSPSRAIDFFNEPFKKRKLGRNDPCPCGSGNKYKKCCLHRKRS